jgi:membrane associated rhomboid family serine protease
MGISDRDYYRDSTRSAWSSEGSPVVRYLIAINIIVFLLQIFIVRPAQISPREAASQMADDQDEDHPLTKRQTFELMRQMQRVPVVQEWFELDTNKVVYGGQVWRLLTHAFCHDRHSIWHILFNMLFLYWFGRELEVMYGSREFLLFYLTAALCAGLAYVGLDLYTGSSNPAIGASGAVLGVAMLYTMHFPDEEICIFWVIPVPMRWVMALYVIWDLHPVLLALTGNEMHTGVAHVAHLGGMAFGFLYAWYDWRLERIGEYLPWLGWRVKLRPRKRRLRLYRDPDPQPEASSLDRVLEKISVSGQDSLNEEERTILRTASEELKNRTRGG